MPSSEAYPPTPSDTYKQRQSEDEYSPDGSTSWNRASEDYRVSPRRASEDRRRPSGDLSSVSRKPSVPGSGSGGSGSNANMATSGMIIPAKSTIAEEEIEVPFARRNGHDDNDDGDQDQDEEGGFGTTSRRIGSRSDRRSAGSASNGEEDDRDYFDRMSTGRGSVTSERAGRPSSGQERGGRTSVGSAVDEKMRREYEFRIATMQSKIVSLEREAEERTNLIEDYRRVRADPLSSYLQLTVLQAS
jgi:protein SPA2